MTMEKLVVVPTVTPHQPVAPVVLALLPAQHLIITQAEQDQRIYEVPQRRSLYIEARGKAENKGDDPEFGLTARFDAFLSLRTSSGELRASSSPLTFMDEPNA